MRLKRIVGWLAALLVLAGMVGPVQAQDNGDDEQQDTGAIYAFRTEILFPAVVRFFVGVNVPPSEIVSVSLTVRQGDTFEQTFTVDPETYLFEDTGAATQLAYPWDITRDPAPIPFVPLNFMWQVETADGAISTAVGESIFEDVRRGEWQSAGQPPLILHWTNENLAGRSIWDEVMAAYSLMSRQTGLTPFFEFAIYDPDARLCQTVRDPDTDEARQVVISPQDGAEFPCSLRLFEDVYAAGDMTFISRPTFGYAELQDLLVTEIARGTYTRLWGDQDVPAWFLNGLAFLYRLHTGAAALEVARNAARIETVIEWAELTTPLPDDAPSRERVLWEAESYLLVLYLAEQHGADAPFDLALAIPDEGFDAALRALTGDDLETLWDNWLHWLFTPAAQRAVGWTPYLVTTPTPTPTPTATAIPPTPTASSTPTITPSPTSTFLGDQLPTPIVITITATNTRPPTNTPLPPGSLPTARPRPPIPTPETETNDTGSAETGGIVALVAAVVVLVGLLAWIALRRRR
jgi:hypothetical protein